MLGIKEFDSDLASARFNDLSHWGYGTSWGALRGLLAADVVLFARFLNIRWTDVAKGGAA